MFARLICKLFGHRPFVMSGSFVFLNDGSGVQPLPPYREACDRCGETISHPATGNATVLRWDSPMEYGRAGGNDPTTVFNVVSPTYT